MIQLCFFEDVSSEGLLPVNITRPTDYLRTGILRIFEKWLYLTDAKFHTRVLRPEFKNLYPDPDLNDTEPCLWINSRYLPDPEAADEYLSLQPGEGFIYEGRPVVVCLSHLESRTILNRESGPLNGALVNNQIRLSTTSKGLLIKKPADLFLYNSIEIHNDLTLLKGRLTPWNPEPGAYTSGSHPVFLSGEAKIEPGTTFITEDGPVILGDGVHVMAGSVVRGPSVILDHSVVKMGSHIDHGTTIGPWCKVGGDISNSVIQGYTNKAHEGYMGNSYIGEWCNLGAGTTTSNLKNTYGHIRMTDWSTGELYDTGLQFCGMIMADHSKTAIGTRINAGSTIGAFCNLVSNDILSGCYPSFTWLTPGKTDRHHVEKALETAKIVMARRNVEMTPEYENMVRSIFEKSELEPERANVENR